MTIGMFIGDSFTNDSRIPTAQQYPSIVGAALGITVINAGVSGNTSSDVIVRLPSLVALNPDIIWLMIGVNDINHAITDGTTNQSMTTATLANLANIRNSFAGKPFKIIVPNVSNRLNETLRMFELRKSIELFCANNGCQFIDIWAAMAHYAGTVSASMFDGLFISGDYHPSVASHALTASYIIQQSTSVGMPSQSAWSRTLTLDSTPNVGTCFRTETLLSSGGMQIRARWRGSSTHNGLTVTRASVGLQASGPNIVAIPVPLKFGAADGFSTIQGGIQWSEWTTLATSAGQILLWDTDCGLSGDTMYAHPTGETGKTYYKTNAAAFDQSSVSGFVTDTGYVYPIDAVEVR